MKHPSQLATQVSFHSLFMNTQKNALGQYSRALKEATSKYSMKEYHTTKFAENTKY